MGTLKMYVGCMYSGKTERLRHDISLQRFRFDHTEEKPTVLLFKPAIDIRYGEATDLISHNGTKIPGIPVSSTAEIAEWIARHKHVKVVGIDEVQFLDDLIIDWCVHALRHTPLQVIACGLNTDFRGELFRFRDSERTMGELMGYAQVQALSAICGYRLPDTNAHCPEPAHFTQRLKPNGEPAPYTDPLVHVGGKHVLGDRYYEARCVQHHVVPGRKELPVTFK